MEYNCPNCGAPINFQSRVSIFTTCTYCRSNIVRHDMDLEKIGEASELLQDLSPFQVGTRGTIDGKRFTLLGRIKVGYPTGMWSEWYALMDDYSEGWLAEAQGYYMMSYPWKGLVPESHQRFAPRQSTNIDGKRFVVDDVRKIRYLASEGELPFVYQPGFEATSVDLRSPDGEFMNFLYRGKEAEAYKGRYASFESFQFENLRKIDGWDD